MSEKMVKLICVLGGSNNNKYYHMINTGDGNWRAEYGRVGADKSQKKVYPLDLWDSKYREKLGKGYKDVTELFVEVQGTKKFASISNNSIAQIVNRLQSYAKGNIQLNYTVSSEQVTQKQIDEAQAYIDAIVPCIGLGKRTQTINDLLLSLYTVIPRKMRHVDDHLLQFSKIEKQDEITLLQSMIDSEQQTLDVMRGQVNVNAAQSQQEDDSKSILDAMGIEIKNTEVKDVELIRRLLGGAAHYYKDSFAVVNRKTQALFDNWLKIAKNRHCELHWHGSKNENWYSIISGGLVIRPSYTNGRMYGNGLYYADRALKSIGYTSLDGACWTGGREKTAFLAVYDVHLGNSYRARRREGWMGSLNYTKLRKLGDYDSFFAEKGISLQNNEIIVYNNEQSTIKYLVELKS